MGQVKKILLIGTGGTIASADSSEGLSPVFAPDYLLQFVPEVSGFCTIDSCQILSLDSTNMQPEHWLQIASVIQRNFSNYDGFVITHGTDTMAYTAAMFTYILQESGKPIVITGSQRPITVEGTDAKRNLIDSFRVACENLGGVFIVFNGKVINGSRAVKLRTKSDDAFDSINYPIIATVSTDMINYHPDYTYTKENKAQEERDFKDNAQEDHAQEDRTQLDRVQNASSVLKFFPTIASDVILIKLMPGFIPNIFDYIKGNYRGVVIESFGSGGVPFLGESNVLTKIQDLAESGVIVVITTQCLLEGGNLNLYEVGRKIIQNPVIPAYDMTTEAAVTKLMWALGQSSDFKVVQELFLKPVANDISLEECFN